MSRFLRPILIALVCVVPLGAMAQAPQPVAAPSQPLLEAELDQLVAPIALHPDPLLSEMLIASTYPLEVVHADRWAKANKNLKGDALTAALAKQSWDDSVKSLVQVPNVLSMMAEQLDWTQKLGDAMLAQQADVMDAIQRLRARAQANGKLQSTKEQTVTVKTEEQKQYIVIEPATPGPNLCPILRACSGLWRLALSRLCAVLFSATPRLVASENSWVLNLTTYFFTEVHRPNHGPRESWPKQIT